MSKAFGDRVETLRVSLSCRMHSLPKGLSFLKRLRQKSPRWHSCGIRITRTMNNGQPNSLRKRSVYNSIWLKFAVPRTLIRHFEPPMMRAQIPFMSSRRVRTLVNIKRIVQFAMTNRIPLAGGFGDWAKEGGLLSYGPDAIAMSARAANYIDKILKGAKPADLPVEQPAKFQLIINLTTAKALGLTIPYSLLSRADELIE